jgi:hypothetical protein
MEKTMHYERLELHLAAQPLSRKHAKAIKAAGGSYSECRGDQRKRFVHVPVSERDLIDELVRTYTDGPKVTIVARGGDAFRHPAWVVVQYVNPKSDVEAPIAQFERKHATAYANADARGLINRHP